MPGSHTDLSRALILTMCVDVSIRMVTWARAGSPGNTGARPHTRQSLTGQTSQSDQRWIVGKITSLAFYKLMTNE